MQTWHKETLAIRRPHGLFDKPQHPILVILLQTSQDCLANNNTQSYYKYPKPYPIQLLASNIKHSTKMAAQPHELTIVAALCSAIKERNALLEVIKSKDLLLEAYKVQASQKMTEKTLCERAQKKLEKYEEILRDNGLEGVEEVIAKLEYLGEMVENLKSGAEEA